MAATSIGATPQYEVNADADRNRLAAPERAGIFTARTSPTSRGTRASEPLVGVAVPEQPDVLKRATGQARET